MSLSIDLCIEVVWLCIVAPYRFAQRRIFIVFFDVAALVFVDSCATIKLDASSPSSSMTNSIVVEYIVVLDIGCGNHWHPLTYVVLLWLAVVLESYTHSCDWLVSLAACLSVYGFTSFSSNSRCFFSDCPRVRSRLRFSRASGTSVLPWLSMYCRVSVFGHISRID